MKKILIILLVFLSVVATAQTGNKDKLIRATDNLQADTIFTYRDTIIPVLDLTYHLWSADNVTWRKNYVLGDRYIKFSNDVKNTYGVIDLLGLEKYWINSGTSLYNNTAYSTLVQIDTTGVSGSYSLFVNGNTSSEYYFLGSDSLMLTNIRSGDGTEGYVLSKSGDSAVWIPMSSSSGAYGRNVGISGYGVYEDSLGSELRFRNIATGDLFIDVAEADSTISITWDGTSRTLTAGVGLSGGGDLSADRTINLYIPELTEMPVTVDYAADWLIINDISTGTHYKIHPEDLLAVLGTYTDSIGIELVGNTFYLGEPSSIDETTVNTVYAKTHTHDFDMDSFELVDLGDVDNFPVSGQYLKWNGTAWVTDDPSTASASNVDLYVDSILVESNIDKINIVEGSNVTTTYLTNGGVKIDSDNYWQQLSGAVAPATIADEVRIGDTADLGIFKLQVTGNAIVTNDLSVQDDITVTGSYSDSNDNPGLSGQILSSTATGTDWIDLFDVNLVIDTLVGTRDTLDTSLAAHGLHTMGSSTDTIFLDNLVVGMTGNIEINCRASADSLLFLSDSTVWVSPYLGAVNKKIPVTNSATGNDTYSYWFTGGKVKINGTKAYE